MSLVQNYQPIETKISPDILDTIGRSFRFKHSKGLAEWLKNSLDNYLRISEDRTASDLNGWLVMLCLIDGHSTSNGPNLAVIDFGGTTYGAVEGFFLNWGSQTAASHGNTFKSALTGGHGNGGKFYMREMWKDGARFTTWRESKVTSLVVAKQSNSTTGYWELQDQTTDWRDALSHAMSVEEGLGGSENIIGLLTTKHPSVVAELDAQTRGFTAVVGRRAHQIHSSNDVVIGGRWNQQKLIDELRDTSQARRPIRELEIVVLQNGALGLSRLMPATIELDPEWPSITQSAPLHLLPSAWQKANESAGTLEITKSSVQLVGRHKDLNTVFVLDDHKNPIAHYPFGELPFQRHSPALSFFSAELRLNFAEAIDLVQNDRERLVSNAITETLLQWVADQIDEQIDALEKQQSSREINSELQKATLLNDSLNRHAKRFLEELQTEIMVDYVESDEGGGPGAAGHGSGGSGKGSGGEGPRNEGTGGGKASGGTLEVPGTSSPARRARLPQVLLSGIDENPADPGSSKQFTDRHPPLEQDDQDRVHNVWWINTTHPFAVVSLAQGGAQGNAFKSHQLFMFRDVVQREALRYLQRRESELGLDRVENELSEASNRFLADLPRDLVKDLLS